MSVKSYELRRLAAKRRGLTVCQADLLDALSALEWRKAPPFTKAATILSLQARGLIEMRPADGFWMAQRYSDYLLRKVKQA